MKKLIVALLAVFVVLGMVSTSSAAEEKKQQLTSEDVKIFRSGGNAYKMNAIEVNKMNAFLGTTNFEGVESIFIYEGYNENGARVLWAQILPNEKKTPLRPVRFFNEDFLIDKAIASIIVALGGIEY